VLVDINIIKTNDEYLEEINNMLDKVKNDKILELSALCTNDILSGFSSEAKDGEKLYDCELTDQSRISGLVQVAQLKLLNIIDEPIQWKAKGELTCYDFTPAEMLKLGVDLKRHIENKTNKFYQLRLQILNSSNIQEIKNIKW
jgi:hypothetical protein